MPDLSKQLSDILRDKGLKLTTAESCTGGLLSAAITALPGATEIFERGFVTYSNDAKIECLSVPKETIAAHGAVSGETAQAMAVGALENARADVALSITGIAGPDGGSTDKPVGTVYIGYAVKGGKTGSIHNVFEGSRDHIREQSVAAALSCLIDALS